MTAESTQTAPRSRRALLAGAIGGLGVWAASAIGRAAPAEAAAGDPIRMGRAKRRRLVRRQPRSRTDSRQPTFRRPHSSARVPPSAASTRGPRGDRMGVGVVRHRADGLHEHRAVGLRARPRGACGPPAGPLAFWLLRRGIGSERHRHHRDRRSWPMQRDGGALRRRRAPDRLGGPSSTDTVSHRPQRDRDVVEDFVEHFPSAPPTDVGSDLSCAG